MKSRLGNPGVSTMFRVILFLGLLGAPGCDIDWAGIIDDAINNGDQSGDFVLTDLVGTWSGTLTTDGTAENYQFVVDSAGSFVAGDGTTGTATITTGGTVEFTYYTSSGYKMELQGTMSSEKTRIAMSRCSWTGAESDSASLTGNLAKTDAVTYLLADMTGTWAGSLTADGVAQNYQFTVDAAGAFVAGNGTTGTATITTGGTVTFTYVTGDGVTMALRGTMNSVKTQITMTTSSWTGTTSGSASFTGILSKS